MLAIHTYHQVVRQSQKRGTVGKDRARKSEGTNSRQQMGLDRLHIVQTRKYIISQDKH